MGSVRRGGERVRRGTWPDDSPPDCRSPARVGLPWRPCRSSPSSSVLCRGRTSPGRSGLPRGSRSRRSWRAPPEHARRCTALSPHGVRVNAGRRRLQRAGTSRSRTPASLRVPSSTSRSGWRGTVPGEVRDPRRVRADGWVLTREARPRHPPDVGAVRAVGVLEPDGGCKPCRRLRHGVAATASCAVGGSGSRGRAR